MRIKFFKEPKFHDLAFYNTREVAHHLDQPGGHSLRLYTTAGLVFYVLHFGKVIKTIFDAGCGDGGLLTTVAKMHPELKYRGMDLQKTNVDYAQERIAKLPKGIDISIKLGDFTKEEIPKADLFIMTETLEHLVDPDGFLKKLLKNANMENPALVVSTPCGETLEHRIEPLHLWGWDKEALLRMMIHAGWKGGGLWFRQGQIQFALAFKHT